MKFLTTYSIALFVIVVSKYEMSIADEVLVPLIGTIDGNFTLSDDSVERTKRHLLALGQDFSSDSWKAAVESRLNDIRRTALASNMYYASWEDELQRVSSTIVSKCKLQTQVVLDSSRYSFASGIIGVMSLNSDIESELLAILNQGPTGKYFAQFMLWSMTRFGCAVNQQSCGLYDKNGTKQATVRPFACLFSYKSAMSLSLYATTGINCSMCQADALMCDGGLCRGYCRPNDYQCARCRASCSECSRVTSLSNCQCVCYYGNGTQRCQDTIESSPYQPVCSDVNYRVAFWRNVPGWVIAIIVVSCVLLSAAVAMTTAYCIQWQKSRRLDPSFLRNPPAYVDTEQHDCQQADVDHATLPNEQLFTTSFPLSFPPPYLDGKPPEYVEISSSQWSSPESYAARDGDGIIEANVSVDNDVSQISQGCSTTDIAHANANDNEIFSTKDEL